MYIHVYICVNTDTHMCICAHTCVHTYVMGYVMCVNAHLYAVFICVCVPKHQPCQAKNKVMDKLH